MSTLAKYISPRVQPTSAFQRTYANQRHLSLRVSIFAAVGEEGPVVISTVPAFQPKDASQRYCSLRVSIFAAAAEEWPVVLSAVPTRVIQNGGQFFVVFRKMSSAATQG